MRAQEVEYAAWRQHPMTRDLMQYLDVELARLRSAVEANAISCEHDKVMSFAQQAFAVNSVIKHIVAEMGRSNHETTTTV